MVSKKAKLRLSVSVRQHVEKSDLQIVEENYPVISFRYYDDVSVRKNKDVKFLGQLLMHFREITSHTWDEISKAGRHSMIGFEYLPLDCFVPQKFPEILLQDNKKLMVFRSAGDNRVMAGVRKGEIFYVIFVETEFGDICRH